MISYTFKEIKALKAERAEYPSTAPKELLGNPNLWEFVADKVGHNLSIPLKILGSGTQGTAYTIYRTNNEENGVMKVTFDSSEACISSLLLKNPHPNFVTIFEVFGFKPVEAPVSYCILQEKLSPPTPEFIDFANLFKGIEITLASIDEEVSSWTNDKIVRYSHLLEWLRNSAEHLESLGIKYKDFRGKNIMLRGEKPVIIDVGYGVTPKISLSVYMSKPDFDRHEKVLGLLKRRWPKDSVQYEEIADTVVPVRILDYLMVEGRYYLRCNEEEVAHTFIIPIRGARRWAREDPRTKQ